MLHWNLGRDKGLDGLNKLILSQIEININLKYTARGFMLSV